MITHDLEPGQHEFTATYIAAPISVFRFKNTRLVIIPLP